MKKNLIRILALLLCAALLLPLCVRAENTDAEEKAAESETEYEQYTVSTAEDLEKLAKLCRLDSASRNLKVLLTADIDVKDLEGFEIPTFGGIFDGQGHKIYGLAADSDGSAKGLFRYIQEGATVKNLQIIGRVIPSGSSTKVGGLAGVNAGLVQNVSFFGAVCGISQVGGIVGVNEVSGRVEKCTMKGYIRGSKVLGGIVGENSGVLYDCVNKANINTVLATETLSLDDITIPRLTSDEGGLNGSDIGGVVGSSSGVIRLCRNEGNVGYQHTGYNIGGVAGSSSGFMADCVNYGDVYARKEGGGVLGQMEPNNILVYDEDTLQKLEKELQTAQGILNRAAYDAGNANSSIQAGLVQVQGSMNDLLSAIDYLLTVIRDNTSITDPNPDWKPGDDIDIPDINIGDMDAIWAAAGTVGSCMSDLVWQISSVSQSAAEDGGQVIADLKSLTSQMSRVVDVMSGREENENIVEDVSGENVETDSAGKMRNCINYGTVNADINAGGIVGALSWENDLDPEDDLTVQGDSSLNFTFRTRALVYQCQNRGTVTAKKQCAGGIVGKTTLGAIVGCEGYGTVDSLDASWVGGIVGQTKKQVSDNWAKCHVSGANLVGGIAGQASQLMGNRALVTLENAGENTGAIAGKLDADGECTENCFVASDDFAGIDGISYAGSAEPISYNRFMELEDVPEAFHKMVITFVADNQTFTRRVDYNRRLKDIPEVPEKDGYSGVWADFDPAHICADKTVHAEYTELQAAADTGSETGQLPIALAEGSFVSGLDLAAKEISAGLPDGAEIGWSLTVPEDGQNSHTIHLRMPDSKKSYMLYVDTGSGWAETEATQDGSYLLFTASGNTLKAALRQKQNPMPLLLTCAAAAAVLLLVILLLVHRKKKKSRKKKTAVK